MQAKQTMLKNSNQFKFDDYLALQNKIYKNAVFTNAEIPSQEYNHSSINHSQGEFEILSCTAPRYNLSTELIKELEDRDREDFQSLQLQQESVPYEGIGFRMSNFQLDYAHAKSLQPSIPL